MRNGVIATHDLPAGRQASQVGGVRVLAQRRTLDTDSPVPKKSREPGASRVSRALSQPTDITKPTSGTAAGFGVVSGQTMLGLCHTLLVVYGRQSSLGIPSGMPFPSLHFLCREAADLPATMWLQSGVSDTEGQH